MMVAIEHGAENHHPMILPTLPCGPARFTHESRHAAAVVSPKGLSVAGVDESFGRAGRASYILWEDFDSDFGSGPRTVARQRA